MVLTKTQINAIKNDFYKRVADKDPDRVDGSIHHEAKLVWETIVNAVEKEHDIKLSSDPWDYDEIIAYLIEDLAIVILEKE